MQILTQTVRWSLVLILVATPWFFGGVWASVQWVLMFVGAVLLALDLVTRFGDDDRPNLVPSAWLPVLLGIALGLFQLVPWSPQLAAILAPASLDWRRELTSEVTRPTAAKPSDDVAALSPATEEERKDTPPASDDTATETSAVRKPSELAEQPLGTVTRSLYPAATREYLALLTLAMAIFVLASVHLVDRQSVVWFFGALGMCGAALSFFGLIQRLSWNGKFYWIFEPINGGVQSFGPFVNRNNAGGFLNLCLAAGIGLLVWLHRDQSWTTGTITAKEEPETRRRSRDSMSRSRRRHPRESSRSASQDRPRDTNDADDSLASDSQETNTANPSEIGPATDTENRSASASDPPSTEDLMSAYRRTRNHQTTDNASPNLDAEPEVVPSDLAQRDTGHDADQAHSSRERGGSGSSSSGDNRSRRRSGGHTRYAMAANPASYGGGGGRGRSKHGKPWERLQEFVAGYMGDFDALRFGSLAIVGCTAGGVLCTASRGSIVAMFAAAMVTVMVLAMRRGNRGYAAGMLVMLVAGVGLMSWSGQTEFVQSRFQELFEDELTYESGRLPNWEEALHAWPDFKVAGTGLGTYRLIYERYQQRYLRETVHTHAENQFIQSMVEGGGAALTLLLIEIMLTALAIVRLYRTGGPVNNALAIAGTYGLASQFVGGMFDFGLYIPSNTILMAAICGIVIGRAALLSIWPADALDTIDSVTTHNRYQVPSMSSMRRSSSATLHDDTQTIPGEAKLRRSSAQKRSALRVSRSVLLGLGAPNSVVTLVVGFLLLGCLFGSLEMNKASKIQAALRNAELEQLSLESRPAVLASKAAPLQTALPLRWDDAEAHRQLAELLIQEYRAATYQDLLAEQAITDELTTDEDAGEASESTDKFADDAALPPELVPDLWLRSSVHYLHGLIHEFEREGNQVEVDSLRSGPHVTQFLVPASRHLLLSREIAPTMPQVHYLLAELSAALPDVGDDATHLQRTHLLAPGDAELWYWSGVLDLGANRIEQACKDWNTSLVLSPIYADSIVESIRGRLTVRQLFSEILPQQADLLLYVIQRHFGKPELEAIRQRLLKIAEAALPETKLPPVEFHYVAARIFNLQNNYAEAIKHYADAIAAKPTALNWRYEYAVTLLKAKRFEEAIEQTTYLVRVAPQNTGYQNLMKDAISQKNHEGMPVTNTK